MILASWMRFTTLTVCWCLLAIGPGCRKQLQDSTDTDEIRREIQAICGAENEALARRDLEAAFAPYAPDWVVLDADGSRRTLEQDRNDTKEIFRVLKSFQPTTVVEEVTPRVGHVVAIDRSEGVMEMENRETGKKATIRYAMVSEVLWRRSGNSWLAYQTRVLSRQRWVDGKLVTSQTAATSR